MANETDGDQMPGTTGHNSVAGDILRNYIERIERLVEEKKALQGDISDIFGDAKGNGYEPKIMRLLLKLRAMEPHDRKEQAALLDVYAHAIGDDLC